MTRHQTNPSFSVWLALRIPIVIHIRRCTVVNRKTQTISCFLNTKEKKEKKKGGCSASKYLGVALSGNGDCVAIVAPVKVLDLV